MNNLRLKLQSQRDHLIRWLIDDAYPLWSIQGVDARNGGFVEELDQRSHKTNKPRRSRVHPRQIYSFAMAEQFGWTADVTGIIKRGMDYFVAHYRREDGLFRTLCDAEGKSLDDHAYLYDQAFALLSFASAAQALNARVEYESKALTLRNTIEQQLRTHEKGFVSGDTRSEIRKSNPHMHLLEACLAWCEVGNDAGWHTLAEELTNLAMEKFIQPNGALKEFFTDDWQPTPGTAGRIVEPGHQFEWAWLLLRCNRNDAQRRRDAALKLIEIGESHGIYNGVVINALLDDFSIDDANARLWCQTEKIKAAVLAAQTTGEEKYLLMTCNAIDGLLPYLNTSIKGLWLDAQQPDGKLIDEPSPASTFYHIVAAIAQLDESINAARTLA